MKKMRQKEELWNKKFLNQDQISTMLFMMLEEKVKDVRLLESPLMLILLLQILQVFFSEDDDRQLYKN
jgi:hypothetical protein